MEAAVRLIGSLLVLSSTVVSIKEHGNIIYTGLLAGGTLVGLVTGVGYAVGWLPRK